ncbi:TetR/AcrR family transcriptional regulator [Oryzobacter telluris]|uniref:TetR/AcrR family transcriptional regulator n=1 Tax=Oryzobacter telluris TaxID=3149179 RepID=UPI00370D5514
MPPTRADRRQDVTDRILEIGRRHLAEEGAAGLSLRAVTRELGMVSSAVYRYVANRDELLTLLVVDAYTDLADAVDAAVADAARRSWRERLVVGALAFRAWAVADPARYALLYGSPVPGYVAPAERTTEPGTRVVLMMAALVAEGAALGEVTNRSAGVPLPRSLATELTPLAAEVGLPGSPAVAARAAHLWATLVGAVSLEVFGQYGPDGPPAGADLLEHQVRLVLHTLTT